MGDPDVDIRTMRRADLDLAVEWAAAEGWNPGLHDAGIFYATDPQGYFMAFQDGEPIGSISAVAYDQAFGFVGFFIVKPGYRGGRVGLQLGRCALDYLGGRIIGIDGVEKKEHNYAHYGFQLAYHNIRHAGRAIVGRKSDNLCPVASVPAERLAEYDRRFFPAPRAQFLSLWVSQPGSVALAITAGDGLAGYGVIRPCRQGFKIGPLFADDPGRAEELFLALIDAARPGGPVYIDIPEVNPDAMAMARRYAMQPVFMTARMYNRPVAPLPMRQIFGVTSFELG